MHAREPHFNPLAHCMSANSRSIMGVAPRAPATLTRLPPRIAGRVGTRQFQYTQLASNFSSWVIHVPILENVGRPGFMWSMRTWS